MKRKQAEQQARVSITTNFLMNALLTASNFIFPLITYPYVSRILLPAGTGKVSFATSLVYYFTVFAQLGIPTYGVRLCAGLRDDRKKLSRAVQELLLIQLITTLIAGIAFVLAIFSVPRLQQEKQLYMVVGAGIIFQLLGMEWLYRALEQYQYIAKRSLIFKAIAVVMMFLLIRAEKDYVIYGALSIFASSASYVCNFINSRKYVDLFPPQKLKLRNHLKPILVFFAMSCAVTLYSHIDTIMLGFIKTDAEVGYYNTAIKVKTIMVSFITSLSVVLLPRAAYYRQHGMLKQFEMISRKSLNFSTVAASPIALYFIIFAAPAVYLLSGSLYAPSILPMRIIMVSLVLIGISYAIGMQILVPLGKERSVLYSEISGAVVNIISNAILIPAFSTTGAAISNVLAEGTVLLVQLVAVRRAMNNVFEDVRWLKIIAALLAGICASVWVLRLSLGNFLTMAISAVCFFAAYLLMLIAARESLTLQMLTQMIGKVKKLLHRDT